MLRDLRHKLLFSFISSQFNKVSEEYLSQFIILVIGECYKGFIRFQLFVNAVSLQFAKVVDNSTCSKMLVPP